MFGQPNPGFPLGPTPWPMPGGESAGRSGFPPPPMPWPLAIVSPPRHPPAPAGGHRQIKVVAPPNGDTRLDPVGRTARWVAAARAIESGHADSLFNDPYAERMAGPEGLAMLHFMGPAAASVTEYLALRTRFLDDFLGDAVEIQGIHQVVILAAGMDTRAFRLEWPARTRLFELDRPEVLAIKDEILNDCQAKTTAQRTTIGLDLTLPWAPALEAAGFQAGERTVWLIEGLLPYLTPAEVDGFFAVIGALSAPGSQLAGDVPGTVDTANGRLPLPPGFNVPWKFGTDHIDDILAGLGWIPTITRPESLSRTFGRPILPPLMLPNGTAVYNHLFTARRA